MFCSEADYERGRVFRQQQINVFVYRSLLNTRFIIVGMPIPSSYSSVFPGIHFAMHLRISLAIVRWLALSAFLKNHFFGEA